MDESDPKTEALIRAILQRETSRLQIKFHGLRHRNAGAKLMIEFHLLFPQNVSIAAAHERATMIEEEIHKAFPNPTEVISHLEPIEGHDEIHRKILKEDEPRTGS